MTDPQKLQQLFEAALRAPAAAEGKAALARAFPIPAPIAAPPTPAEAVREAVFTPVPPVASAAPLANPGLNEAASAKLGALLDDSLALQKRRRRRELIGTFVVLIGLTGGGLGWFVQSSARIQAFREAAGGARA